MFRLSCHFVLKTTSCGMPASSRRLLSFVQLSGRYRRQPSTVLPCSPTWCRLTATWQFPTLPSVPEYCLSTSIGAWATTTPLPSTIYQHSSVVYNGYIYTTGGNVGGGVVTSTVFYAPITSTGSIGAWQKTTALPSAIYGLSAVINNGYIYTTGGQTSAPTSTVFYAPINSANGSGLTLVNTGGTTISYCVVSGVLYRQAGGAACSAASSAITDNKVLVATSKFTRLENTNAILGKTVVSIQADFVMSYNATGPENQYSEEEITTVALRNY